MVNAVNNFMFKRERKNNRFQINVDYDDENKKMTPKLENSLFALRD